MENALSFATTGDGSKTIFNAHVGEYYHSRHGALQESRHVFLKSGLEFYLNLSGAGHADVLEVGFGTGLNFLLSADYCVSHDLSLSYTGIEAYPLDREMIFQTGYEHYVSGSVWTEFCNQYEQAFSDQGIIGSKVLLSIARADLMQFHTEKRYDVVYFDAFAAVHQPEMWTVDALQRVTTVMRPGGVFVTYAITGNLKRAMKELGFSVEKAPGAPGKREMLRAVKL